MSDSDLIPPSFVAPPFSLEHPFAVWQAFAVRAVLPGLAFNLSLAGLAVGLSRWVDVPLTLISIAGLATFGGLLKGLNDSREWSIAYAKIVIETYKRNNESYRVYLKLQVQVNQVKAGKGSQVNISQHQGPLVPNGGAEIQDSASESRAAFVRHVSEFRAMVAKGVRDVNREDWLAHKGPQGTDMPAYQFSDGARITRSEYDQIIAFMQTLNWVADRGKGKKGQTTPALLDDSITP